MVTLTRWACKVFGLALLVLACHQKAPVPTLESALKVSGGPAAKSKAFLEVALAGAPAERREAAMLWGLYACDAGAPLAALRAFALAQPTGGQAAVAARRLEEAVARGAPSLELLGPLEGAGWLPPEARERLLLTVVEGVARRGNREAARAVLPPAEAFSAKNRPRARVLRAQLWPQESTRQKQELLLESPQEFRQLFPTEDWEKVAAGLTPEAQGRLAEAFLAAGDGTSALRAASRAGSAAVAAQAALRLRRPHQAQLWAERLPQTSPKRPLLLAQALRQRAWQVQGEERRALFSQVWLAAREAEKRAAAEERAEAQVLQAEALVELGRLAEVPPLLEASAAAKPARWEWVARRALLAFAQRGETLTLPPTAGARLSRLNQLWAGWVDFRRGNPEKLRALAASGHPDLPAQWAARRVAGEVRWQPSNEPAAVPEPPAWATWWLRAGRVADVVWGWRAELEAAGSPQAAWLGLLRLAAYPPLDTIPLLIRAEPRLLSGPWSQVSRELLVQYLPLPYRAELEAAAGGQRLPPWMLAAVVRQESAFNPRARSPKGAIGLAQLLPSTAGLSASALEDPATNLQVGARYLAQLLERFDGAWEPALAAYNAGESRVRSTWDTAGRREGPLFVESLELPETWDYVHRVMLLAEGYRVLYWSENSPGE